MALPKTSCVRPEAQSVLAAARACCPGPRKSVFFGLGSVVRRTGPHVRCLFVAYVVRVFVLFFCCVTNRFFDLGSLCVTASRQAKLFCKKARPSSGPPGGGSLVVLVNENGVRPRYAGPNDEGSWVLVLAAGFGPRSLAEWN